MNKNVHYETPTCFRWVLDSAGLLTISPAGDNEELSLQLGIASVCPSEEVWPWLYFKNRVRKVLIEPGVKAGTSIANIFSDLCRCTEFDVSGLDTSRTELMTEMFCGCSKLVDIKGLDSWDTGNVRDMRRAFCNCCQMTDISAVKEWNTGKLEDTDDMFYNCESLADISPLAKWNMEAVKRMDGMFARCICLSDVSPLAEWHTESATDLHGMFDHCEKLRSLTGLEKWNTEKIENMCEALYCCYSLTDISALDGWHIKEGANLNRMFHGCKNLHDISAIRNWNLANAADMKSFLGNCNSLPEGADDFIPMACPRKGTFVAWKKCRLSGGSIPVLVKLRIPEDARRSSAGSAPGSKCRADKAEVLGVFDMDGKARADNDRASSIHAPLFIYSKGQTVSVPDFNADRWNECAAGIHFFMNLKDAAAYQY